MKAIHPQTENATQEERDILSCTGQRRAVIRGSIKESPRDPIVTDAFARAIRGATVTVVAPTVAAAERLATPPIPHPYCGPEPTVGGTPTDGDSDDRDRGIVGEGTSFGNRMVGFDDGKVYFESASVVDDAVATDEAFYVVHADLIPEYVKELDTTVANSALTVSLYNTAPFLENGNWDVVGGGTGVYKSNNVAMGRSD